MRVLHTVGGLMAFLWAAQTAAHDLTQDEALHLREQGVILPLAQLTEQALARYPGATLLEVELEKEHGRMSMKLSLCYLVGRYASLNSMQQVVTCLKTRKTTKCACFL